MNLRIKLTLPVVIFVLIIMSMLHLYALPQFWDNKKSEILTLNESNLELISASLVPYLLSNDFASIAQALDTAKSFANKGGETWKGIELYDANQIKLYPLLGEEIDHSLFTKVSTKVEFAGKEIGRLTLFIDLEELVQPFVDKVYYYERIFTIIFVIFLLSVWKIQEAIIVKPLLSLVGATNRLANGDYDFDLATARSDEVGRLVKNFDTMRHSIKKSQEKFTTLFKQSTDPCLIIEGNNIVECNDKAHQLLNYSAAELKEIQIKQLFSKDIEFRLGQITYDNEKMQNGFETQVLSKGGNKTPVEVYTSEIEYSDHKSWMLTLHNITERKKSEEVIKTSEERLKLGLENSSTGLWDWQLVTDKVYFNTQWYKLLGYKKAEISESMDTWRKLIHPDDHDAVNLIIEDHLKNGVDKIYTIHRLKHKNKNWRWVKAEGKVISYSHDGKPLRVVGTLIDITDRINAEMALKSARDEAEKAVKIKSQFLANMSHEIRTPMNGVLGMLHLLSETNLASRQSEFVSAAKNSASSLLTLINDILDYSKIESGQLSIEKIEFDLYELISDVCNMLMASAVKNKVDLIIDYHPEMTSRLVGDPTRIRQIIVNLMSNAIKFSPNGRVVIRVKAKSTDKFVIEVQDNGIGISQEIQEKLFSPFTQADGSTTRKYGGTGLGLSISRRLAELMDGSLALCSRQGKGSCFSAILPLDVVSTKTPQQNFTGQNIVLIAEENHANTFIMNELNQLGFKVKRISCVSDENLVDLHKKHYSHFLIDYDFAAGLTEDGESVLAHFAANKDISLIGMARVVDTDLSLFDKHCQFVISKPFKSRYFATQFQNMLDGVSIEPFETDSTFTTTEKSNSVFAGKQILLVEDIEVNQLVAKEMLSALGADVVVADNGVQALEEFKVSEVDGVLMDCQMPVMDGFEATAAIRKWEAENRIPETPIIALTANALNEDRRKCLDTGMNDFLAKPIDPEKLKIKLEKWVMGLEDSSFVPTEIVEEAAEPVNKIDSGVDTEKVIMLKTLMQEDFEDLIETYKTDQAQKIKNLWDCYREKNHEDAYKMLHGLKGSSSNIGAVDVAEDCARFEDKVKHGKFELMEADLIQLDNHFKITLEKIIQLSH